MVHLKLRPDLELKSLEMGHAAELFKLVDRNRARLREWLPWLDRNTSEKDSLAFIRGAIVAEADNKGITAGIWLNGKIVGVMGQHPIDWLNRSVAIGYWLDADASGKGVVTEVARAFTDHCFQGLGLHRVEIRAATGNARSQRVAERLGFQFEGIAREAEQLYGRYVDLRVYSMLAQEWKG